MMNFAQCVRQDPPKKTEKWYAVVRNLDQPVMRMIALIMGRSWDDLGTSLEARLSALPIIQNYPDGCKHHQESFTGSP